MRRTKILVWFLSFFLIGTNDIFYFVGEETNSPEVVENGTHEQDGSEEETEQKVIENLYTVLTTGLFHFAIFFCKFSKKYY